MGIQVDFLDFVARLYQFVEPRCSPKRERVTSSCSRRDMGLSISVSIPGFSDTCLFRGRSCGTCDIMAMTPDLNYAVDIKMGYAKQCSLCWSFSGDRI